MAITFKLDDNQHAKILQTIKDGFDGLVGALTGTTEQELQTIIDQLATKFNLDADEIQAALKQSKTEGE